MIKFNATGLLAALAIAAAAPAAASTIADTTSAIYTSITPSNIFTLNNACGCDPSFNSIAIQQVTLNAKTKLTGIDAALVAINQNDPSYSVAPHFGGFDQTQGYQVNIYSSAAAAAANLTGDVYSLTVAGNAPTFGGALNIDTNQPFVQFSPGSTTASIAIDTVLNAGSYWIGVTAFTDPDIVGQESIFVASGAGTPGKLANPGGSWGATLQDAGFGGDAKLGYRLDGLQGIAGGVPEPASWALLIAGFGFVGAGVRRRRPALQVSHA